MEQHLMSPWQQFGLIGLLSGSGTILLFIIIKWVLATTREIMAQAAKERESWTVAMREHSEQAQRFHDSVKEAHEYQRKEHMEMIQILGRINGYKHEVNT